jgi:hypothetical protein
LAKWYVCTVEMSMTGTLPSDKLPIFLLSKLFNKALCLGNLKANVTPCNFCYNLQNLHFTFQITVRTCSNCNFLNAPSTFQINFHLLVSCEIISILSEWSTAFQMYERFVHQSTYRLSSKPEVE